MLSTAVTWRDSTNWTGCQGSIPTNSRLSRSFRVIGESTYEAIPVLVVQRLDTIQAVVLLKKLPLLDEWNRQRVAVASRYFEELVGIGDLELPPVAPRSSPVWHLFVLRTDHPDRLAEFLRERGIGTGRHYPVPLHLTAAYAPLGYKRGAFPLAERHAQRVLSLPIFPGMSNSQIDAVIDGTRLFFERG